MGGSNAAVLLLPCEAGVGAVTSGTVLVTKPGLVYLGHEGGYVTIWQTSNTSSQTPTCTSSLKIATSDILCMQGVHDRLWSGSRNGFITALDVETKPWTVTNVWKHGGYSGGGQEEETWDGRPTKTDLPVVRLMIDVAGVEKVCDPL